MKIGIIDYGMGNIASVQNALSFLGVESEIVETERKIISCDKLILPGVGAFSEAMINLQKRGLIDVLNKVILQDKKSILGLCLGMQLFFSNGLEGGKINGLNWIEGSVLSIKDEVKLIVPHMGWNNIEIKQPSFLLNEINEENEDFYFVHSYYCKCIDRSTVLATVEYGVLMDVLVQKDNIYGCQFHPEKSQNSGLKIIKNFIDLC